MPALRRPRAPAREPDGAPRVHVVSPDPGLSGKLARRLQGWGASVAVETDPSRMSPSAAADERADVVLLDVRRHADALLAWLAALKRAQPRAEVVLLTVPGQVAISIAAMRAGASSELSAPFDLAALRAAVAAGLRRRGKRLAAPRPSLLERFQRAMTAATFAQAGEFDTARELLADEAPPERPGQRGDP
jgi:DNA-binding response OmpR family regulator